MKTTRTGVSPNHVPPGSWPNVSIRSPRVDEAQTIQNHLHRDKKATTAVELASTLDRKQFQAAIQSRDLDSGLAEQLLNLFDRLLASDGRTPLRLAEILFGSLNNDDVNIDGQFLETVSMLSDAVTDEQSVSTDSEAVLDRFLGMLEEGEIDGDQHTELQALIDSSEVGSASAYQSDPLASIDSELVQSPASIAPPEQGVDKSAVTPKAVNDNGTLTPVAFGVDPEQWHKHSEQADDVPGLSDKEFISALSDSDAMPERTMAERLEFIQYAAESFKAYVNDEGVLFDDEILRMQDDGVLVENDDRWVLNIRPRN